MRNEWMQRKPAHLLITLWVCAFLMQCIQMWLIIVTSTQIRLLKKPVNNEQFWLGF